MLLTRDKFREAVFARDGHKCVFCGLPAKDAHHILERRLFADGGYYVNNGASVCELHHLECEKTIISVEEVRIACGITKPIIPDDMYDDQVYDKWGNICLPNGSRTKGPLFYDNSVQTILAQGGVLSLFTDFVKYPRTYHLPWSTSGIPEDDRFLKAVDNFQDKRVIVTEKLDGENTTLYNNYYHARSVDSRNHPTRNWAKALHSTFAHDIPEGWRICCENMYAVHSIAYKDLESYLYGFSVWNKENVCLSWDESLVWFELLGIPHVPVLFDGIFDEAKIKSLWNEKEWAAREGYVVRIADQFRYCEFRKHVAKFVRPKHIQTTKHWMHGQPIVVNQLKDEG